MHVYTDYFLVKIETMMPDLREKVIPFFKKTKSPYLKEIQALNGDRESNRTLKAVKLTMYYPA